MYSKVLSKKEQQQKAVTQSQSEYSILQHKKVDDIALPVCSPQLYSILDSPHRTVPTSAITKHTSLTTPVTAEHSSSDSIYAISDDDDDKHRPRQRHKSFQPIVYLPPKSSSERRHGSGNKRIRKHHRDDSGMVARSTSSDHLKKNEYLVQGTTLDGSVTLYAASPVGSPIPPDQTGPILNRLSSRPVSRQDHMIVSSMEQSTITSQHPHPPHQSSMEQHRSLEQPVMMQQQQQQWTMPPVTSVSQPVSTSASLTTSVDLPDHQQHQGQKLSYSLPPSFDHSNQHQGQNADGNKPLFANLDQYASQSSNNNRSLTGNNNDTRQDQRTSSSLYQDMLELMQKRETELTVQVNTIAADKERLQAEKTLLQQETESSRKPTLIYTLITLVLTGETIPMLQSQVSSLQVENQMLQLTGSSIDML